MQLDEEAFAVRVDPTAAKRYKHKELTCGARP
jgi:hypothetical protein